MGSHVVLWPQPRPEGPDSTDSDFGWFPALVFSRHTPNSVCGHRYGDVVAYAAPTGRGADDVEEEFHARALPTRERDL